MKLYLSSVMLLATLTYSHVALGHDLGECPTLVKTSLKGDLVDVRNLDAKLIIVEYWATWCPPCVANLRHLEKLKQTYKGVEVVGVNSEEDAGEVLAFMTKWGLDVLTIWDRDMSLLKAADPPSLPYTVVLNASGCVIWKGNGAGQETLKSLKTVVDRHVGGR